MEPLNKKSKSVNKQCFVLYSDEELKRKHDASRNINTSRSKDCANTAFRKFLQQVGKSDLDYWFYEEEELDCMLEKFRFGAHKDIFLETDNATEDRENDELLYSANTMKNFHYPLN